MLFVGPARRLDVLGSAQSWIPDFCLRVNCRGSCPRARVSGSGVLPVGPGSFFSDGYKRNRINTLFLCVYNI